MTPTDTTPCFTLFDVLKSHGGISYKDAASMVLSGKPLSDGRSPVGRVGDRTWVSRFVVHAPAGSLQDRYFCDFSTSALRIVARLKSQKGGSMTGEDILAMVCGDAGRPMARALAACHQNETLYRNTLERLAEAPGLTSDERAEAAMVLFVAAGCTADARRASVAALDFMRTVHGGGVVTPAMGLGGSADGIGPALPERALGLLRLEGGYVCGAPRWLSAGPEGTVVGALAVEEGAVNEVGPTASGRHLRVRRAEDGRWLAEGLSSRNGTVLVSGLDGTRIPVEPPQPARDPEVVSAPIEIHPGDQLILGEDTTFLVLEGYPQT